METRAHGVGVAGDGEANEVTDNELTGFPALHRHYTAPAFRGVPINKHRRRRISTEMKGEQHDGFPLVSGMQQGQRSDSFFCS